MRSVSGMAWKALKLLRLDALARLLRNSALTNEGWWKSYQTKLSVGADGQPVPWYTYSFAHFLRPRLRESFRVFEYGGVIRRYGMQE